MTAPYTSQNVRVQQTSRGTDIRELISAFEVLTKAAYTQLGSTSQTAFFIGDGLQSLVIASAFGLLSPQTWTPENILQMSSLVARQADRISELFTSPAAARLAWQELRNKIEVYSTVRNLSTLLGLSG